MGSLVLDHDWFPKSLPDNVEIGERSWVYSSFAFLHCESDIPVGVRIGEHSGIYAGTFFELGPRGQVEIGDFCSVVGAIIRSNGKVTIEDYSFIAHEVVIADHAHARPGFDVAGELPPIVIGRNSWIGERAVLLSGASLGEGAIVGAYAVVDFQVPDFAIVAGNPARIVGSALGEEVRGGNR